MRVYNWLTKHASLGQTCSSGPLTVTVEIEQGNMPGIGAFFFFFFF